MGPAVKCGHKAVPGFPFQLKPSFILSFLARLPMNSCQLSLDFGAVAPVGRIIPNPPGLILAASNRRVKDNAPYLFCGHDIF